MFSVCFLKEENFVRFNIKSMGKVNEILEKFVGKYNKRRFAYF